MRPLRDLSLALSSRRARTIISPANVETLRGFSYLRSALKRRLGFGVGELLSARTCHGRIRGVASGRGRPPAFFNQLTLLP
jgi:hypothetical protein